VLFSLCCAILFTILPTKVEHTGKMGAVRICIINTILLEAARRRVSDIWGRKAKFPLPGVGDYRLYLNPPLWSSPTSSSFTYIQQSQMRMPLLPCTSQYPACLPLYHHTLSCRHIWVLVALFTLVEYLLSVASRSSFNLSRPWELIILVLTIVSK
jgi:hypothetical protein